MKILREFFYLILLVLFYILLGSLSICLWSILIFSVLKIFMVYGMLNIIYLLLILSLVLIMSTNTLCYVLMYNDKYCSQIENWVCNHSTKPLVIITLGYINVILLNIWYIKEKYSKSVLIYYPITTFLEPAVAMIPILNTIVYFEYSNWLKSKDLINIDFKNWALLFIKGEFMTYIIRSLNNKKNE